MKAIVLAGGKGTRLYPMTKVISKQLLPIYDKPLIYYPISVVLLAGIREILIISSREHINLYKELLGDGSGLGVKFYYEIQEEAGGLAEAFLIGEKFIEDESVCLVLGDNLFYGMGLSDLLKHAIKNLDGATIFAYPVTNPSQFGVVDFDTEGRVKSLVEKPKKPKSKYAIPGLYFYDNNVISIAKNIKPSDRGELEITDVNNAYLKLRKLKCEIMGRGMAWLDTGTPNGLIQASAFVQTVQARQGFYIACLEEIAWRQGFITLDELIGLGKELEITDYGKYILSICE
ncbi:glucose-1-phosphate thymidylyltransferase RfbA [Aminipila sp.]|uniref:glucose-1-phosphate thymidylyltransferase RfbA n=1 Tax=Aminipila sp. TaxID=2060095 RepID=UPI001DDC1D69|nr:glucose-1-phosphate thymidylyltransferase RfbA [Aminipila sp.]MBE6034890.1 glucose-1-phosphate thymidylyltransferase RfbA [Clostridiales bacterium]